jgi:hypothetical protein
LQAFSSLIVHRLFFLLIISGLQVSSKRYQMNVKIPGTLLVKQLLIDAGTQIGYSLTAHT